MNLLKNNEITSMKISRQTQGFALHNTVYMKTRTSSSTLIFEVGNIDSF